jgi:hypothetical protein
MAADGVHGDREHPEQVVRGEDPHRPAEVEPPQRDPFRPPVLLQEQPRDEEAAQHEEGADAEIPGHGFEPEVVRDDDEDRHRAKTVEAWNGAPREGFAERCA